MPQKELNQARYCKMCSSEHEYFGELCPQCGLCFKLCVRADDKCKWFDPPSYVTQIPLAEKHADGDEKVANLPIYENLKGAFESWIASSDILGGLANPERLWIEFETFAKEVLTLVDSEKNYLQINAESGKFKILDAQKLYRNQDNEYVILEDKKRIRIGKTVAVM